MMKKVGLYIFITGLLIAFTLPVSAFTIDTVKGGKMYIGGLFLTDIGYWNRSKERTGVNDQTLFMLNVPTHSRVRGSFEVGDVGGYWELGNGGDVFEAVGNGAGVTNYIETRKLYGWYKFGRCEFRAGKDDGYLYTWTPDQNLGNNHRHIRGYGFGSIFDSRNPQVRLTQKISKEFGYMVTLLQAAVYVDQTRTSYSSIPQVSVKGMMDIGPVSFYPAVLFNTVKWDKMPGGYDDSLTAWMTLFPLRVKARAFTGLLQFGYGQNIQSILTAENSYQQYQRVNGVIKNTTGMNGFIDLGYTIGKATPHIYFGFDRATNSDAYKKGDDSNTQTVIGASLMYEVSPGFFLNPEFSYYTDGTQPGIASKTDLGTEWMGGMQIRFVF